MPKIQTKLFSFIKPKKQVIKLYLKLHEAYTKYVVIDHVVENEKSNNTLENLNPTTNKENIQKSAKLNPDRGKGKGTRPIQGKKIGEKEWVDYTGIIEAARILNLSKGNICNYLRGRRHQAGGYVFRYKDDPDLEGEIWKKNTRVGILVSNMGRVKKLTKNKGTLDNRGYYNVNLNKKKYKVHRLICEAFKWELVQRKFDQQTKYTDIYSFWNALDVNHIDENRGNNHIHNLEPLTRAEHIKVTNLNHKKSSRTRSKPILGKKNGDWVWYSGIKQASRELKVISLDSIYKCLKGKTINGYQFKYAPDPDLPGEIWKDIPQEFFKHSVKGWRVSNKGRVHPKKGVKSYGNKAGKYKNFCSHTYVHRAVAAAFMQDQIMELLRSKGVQIM